MKTRSVYALFALPMLLLAGCGVDASADAEDAPVAQSASAITSSFVFDSNAIAQAPSATLPTARLTLTSFQDSVITRSLINTTDSFTTALQMGSKTQMEGTQWSFGKDPTAGQVLVVRKTPSGPATIVDEAVLQRSALSRLNTWGIPSSEVGTVLQRQSLGEHQDGTSPTTTTRELHRYKTFVFRAINGVRVQGHRAVVSHTPDGTFNRALIKWPPIATTGHALRTGLSTTDIEARAEAALLAEGETAGAVTLRWKYVATPLTNGEVTLSLKVSAVTSPSATTQGATGEETREITVEVDAQ
jgi:hypothetical protein